MPYRPIRAAIAAATLASATALAPPALAQNDPATGQEGRDGVDLDALKQEFDRVWDQMVEEVEPTLDRLENTFDTLRKVDDLRHYEDPEILENGDIIIRRREDAPPLPPVERERESPYGEGGTEL